MDYSQLSDFEINNLVLNKVSNGKPEEWLEPYASFEPCNKAEDAWPIIERNRIGVMPSEMKTQELWLSTSGKGSYAYHENPLRAAMIVYLMMQDAKNA